MVVSCVASFAGMLNHMEGDRARGARILRMSYGGLQIPISATEPVANFSPSVTHMRNGLRREPLKILASTSSHARGFNVY